MANLLMSFGKGRSVLAKVIESIGTCRLAKKVRLRVCRRLKGFIEGPEA